MAKEVTAEKENNVHKGHRERLRHRFLSSGLNDFQDHNVLELLLFYSVPMKDTNEEAHRLIDKFGSLSSVFDASYDELCSVKGIGERSAALIKLMPELFRKYEIDKVKNQEIILNNTESVAKYVSSAFKGLSTEMLYLLCLDSSCHVLSFVPVSEGNISVAPLSVRKIMEIAFKSNASSVILVHNHPSGCAAPSREDIDVTIHLFDILSKVKIKLNDHIIVCDGNEYFSFRKSEKWGKMFR